MYAFSLLLMAAGPALATMDPPRNSLGPRRPQVPPSQEARSVQYGGSGFVQSGLQGVGVDLGVTWTRIQVLAQPLFIFVSLGRFLDSTSQMIQQSKGHEMPCLLHEEYIE